MLAESSTTGIRGIALRGPVGPGPARVGESDEVPFRAVFVVRSQGREVARFESGRNGEFEISLPAGDYAIVPEPGTPIPAPQSQVRSVAVPAVGFAHVTLRFDTGMR